MEEKIHNEEPAAADEEHNLLNRRIPSLFALGYWVWLSIFSYQFYLIDRILELYWSDFTDLTSHNIDLFWATFVSYFMIVVAVAIIINIIKPIKAIREGGFLWNCIKWSAISLVVGTIAGALYSYWSSHDGGLVYCMAWIQVANLLLSLWRGLLHEWE